MLGFIRNWFDTNAKEIKKFEEEVRVINDLEEAIKRLTDEELREKTLEFRLEVQKGRDVSELLPEAFAVVREAALRTLGMRPFDVQLIGGMVLHQGRIAEMKTGEGKTLMATLPVYLNALLGKGVHVITVNDYLAKRDAEWMGQIYRFLGLEVGVIVHGLTFEERRQAYHADITYGTNHEFGFDYLRDNMVIHRDQMVQRPLHYAIVDEVDSILIDEARTPLIISGQAEDSTKQYQRFARLVPGLKAEEHYNADEKARTVALTEEGVARVEADLGVENLFDDENFELNHYLIQALKATCFFERDRDYVVDEGEVIIVDEFTGRLMPGRRYSDGLHQAIEAKEGVEVAKESQTLATITYQNFFRMYDKLSGMTGTAKTEEEEFMKIYGMDVVVIPTNKPMIRKDYPDAVYRTAKGKFEAIVGEIVEFFETGQPVLVGTISIERSEYLSKLLKVRGIPHQVLNAKNHQKEAEIVSQAGQKKTITIATNMAGRGTDIVLGEGVVDLGGLHIIGTERHESRRIDNQLRGRSGRQGDPGSSRFFVSLEDDLMRLFGSDRIHGILNRLGWGEDQAIEHGQITRSIEGAQKKVETRNFDIRKQVLEFDDVMNQQRGVIYSQRRQVLEAQGIREYVEKMIDKTMQRLVSAYANEKVIPEEWDLDALLNRFSDITNKALPFTRAELEQMGVLALGESLAKSAKELYLAREEELGVEQLRQLEQMVLLQMIDTKWMEHLRGMDDLKEGIGLRAYGQRDPLLEYKFEAFEMFKAMTDSIQEECLTLLFRVRFREKEKTEVKLRTKFEQVETNRNAQGEEQVRTPRRVENKVGRNDLCSCNSGKKYKKCCGR